MTKTWIIALAASVTLALAGCGGSAPGGTSGGAGAQTGPIKIGSLHPLSGSSAADGQQLENGAKLAVEAINAAGGVKSLGGAKLELTSGDTQGKPNIGQSEAQRLIQDGAVAIVGTYMSAVSANVASVAERNQVPFVMDITGDDAILSHGYKYSFRLQPPTMRIGAESARHLAELSEQQGKPVKKVAYLHEQSAYGTSAMTGFREEAERLGITVDPVISYDPVGVSDLTTQITQVKASGADVLAVTGYYRDGVLAAKAVGSVKPGLDAVYGVADGAFDLPQFPKDAGAAGEGFFDVNYRLDLNNPETKRLADTYKQRFGDEIRTGAVLAYDAVRTIATGLEKSGSRDPKKLRDVISSGSLPSMLVGKGPVKFDATGQNVNAIPVMMQVHDGAVQVVHPKEHAEPEARPDYPAAPGS
ncbi:MAG: ABC transporter substrate-binding protein [Streptosporangiales bacterium]|nr:ABC transporter substrate-binding protein [Streptosporangiales bacterium]